MMPLLRLLVFLQTRERECMVCSAAGRERSALFLWDGIYELCEDCLCDELRFFARLARLRFARKEAK